MNCLSVTCSGPFPLAQCFHETTIQSFLLVFCPFCPNLRRLLVCIDFILIFSSTPQKLNGQTAFRCHYNGVQQKTVGQTAARCQCNVLQQRSDIDQTVESEVNLLSHGDIALSILIFVSRNEYQGPVTWLG